MSASVEPVSSVDTKAMAEFVRGAKSAWNARDYVSTVSQSRKILEWEPDNTVGLVYLARAAAFTEDWADVISAGEALVEQSPRDAFNAARKLNQAGQTLQAAKIFAALDVDDDWFDAETTQLAWKEAVVLLRAGEAAERDGDLGLAKALWVAGAHIAPRSQLLISRVSELAAEAKRVANNLDREEEPLAYITAWREVLWLDPSSMLAATKLAWIHERLNAQDATDAWVKVLSIEPDNEQANARLQRVTLRNNLEDRAIQGLIELGRDENDDPLIRELQASRDSKARETHDKALKARRRESLLRANAVDRDAEPQQFLAAWKEVLAADPEHVSAARKIVSIARALGDYPELVEGQIALLEFTPDDAALRERLLAAAPRAGKEQRALECLARIGLEHLPADKIDGLRKRVAAACKRALSDADFELALTNFRTLILAGGDHPSIEPLQLALVKKCVSSAREAEKEGDLTVAVPLAEQILEIVPDHPVALKIVARELLRQRRFSDLVEFCGPRVKSGPEYESVQHLIERATEKLAS